MAFCNALTTGDRKAGRIATNMIYRLPTEAEWEYACRAGTTTPFHLGETLSNKTANYNGYRVKDNEKTLYHTGGQLPWGNGFPNDTFRQKPSPVGSFPANAFGLHDMHGNVAEWTRSLHRSYPSSHDDRNDPRREGRRVGRGGSWYDRPKHARSAYRRSHWPYQKIWLFRRIRGSGTAFRGWVERVRCGRSVGGPAPCTAAPAARAQGSGEEASRCATNSCSPVNPLRLRSHPAGSPSAAWEDGRVSTRAS